ncbi:MAG: M48 family metalloprotease [Alphaproteobacteria bacterium]|jgi:predicted Zn-dependent protease|nr:M48 family metalloprotease [Alphaproteobacteria bacterium]
MMMRKVITSLLFLIICAIITPISAGPPQFKTGSVLLDDETDTAFKSWIQKIFTAAGLRQYKPHIYIIVNPDVNAAATVGGIILIYSEFLMKCDNASQFLGVMAHEVGHIAGGHISRMDAAQTQALIPAAAAVILGGALALASGQTAPLEAALAGGAHVFERGMLHYSRAQESSADQAALTYLTQLGWPAEGLSEFLHKIHKMYESTGRVDLYSRSHPLTPDRIQSVHENLRRCFPHNRTIPHDIEAKFQRIKAKLMAFLEPSRALQTYKPSDTSQHARYARAIAKYGLGQFGQALEEVDHLLRDYPKDPYFHELKGQILFETGEVDKAVEPLKKSLSLRANSPLIKIMLAHALIERKSSPGCLEAVDILVPLTQKHPQDYSMAWRLLATAYGKTNRVGEAAYALAEEAFLLEKFDAAKSQAKRAEKLLKDNPKALTRVKDLLAELKNKGT